MKFLLALTLVVLSALAGAQAQLIAKFLDSTANPDPQAIAAQNDVIFRDYVPTGKFALFELRPGQDPDTIQNSIAANPTIQWVEDHAEVASPEGTASKGSTVAAIGSLNTLYGLNANLYRQIHYTPRAVGPGGREIRVAILDNGLSQQRPEVWDKVVASTNFVELGQPAYDYPRTLDTNNNGTADEAVGHGSMVTGLVEQLAPYAKFVIVKVLDSDGNAGVWSIIKGLAFAYDNGADLVNMSFGARDVPALGDALEWFKDRGLLTVAAIGNDNTNRAQEPARFSSAICVAGVDQNDRKATFSNWDGHSDISAPATGLKSYWWNGQLAIWSGTSFAAPLLTGSMADAMRWQRTQPRFSVVMSLLIRYGGDNIDGLNPAYRGELGPRLNVMKLQAGFRRGR
jgi:hypothetical protein